MDEIIAEEEEPKVKSKTQIKRELKELQDLGEEMIEYPSQKIKKLNLPSEIIEAILSAKTLKKNESWRRQVQYIGKLLREIGLEALKDMLETKPEVVAQDQLFQFRLNQTAEKLVAGEKAEMDQLIEKAPTLNIQQLRQLIRKTKKSKTPTGEVDLKPLVKYLKGYLTKG